MVAGLLGLSTLIFACLSSFGVSTKGVHEINPISQAEKPEYLERFVGAGTDVDPFLVKTPQDLLSISEIVNSKTSSLDGLYFLQTADIDLDGYPWNAIGNAYDSSIAFRGIYDGGGKKIFNLNSDDQNFCQGLFGRFGGVGLNIHIASGLVGGWCSGGLVSHSTGDRHGLLINCITRVDVHAGNRAGGLVDNFIGGGILNCVSFGRVTGATIGGISSCELDYGYNLGYRGPVMNAPGVTGGMLECFDVTDMSEKEIASRMESHVVESAAKAGVALNKLRHFIVDENGSIDFGEPYDLVPDFAWGKPVFYVGLGLFGVGVVTFSAIAIIKKKRQKDGDFAAKN